MHRHRINAYVLLLGLQAGAGPLYAGELVINFDTGSPPTMYAGPHGEARGIYPAILRRAFERMGEKVAIRARPFNRLMAEFLDGHAAVGSLVHSPSRDLSGDFSSPYFTENVAVYYDAGRWSGFRYDGPASLKGYRVGVIRGWSYGAAFDQLRHEGSVEVEEVESDAQNFSKLACGRLDFVLAPELAGKKLLDQPRYAGIVAAPNYLVSVDINLAINKQAGQRELLRRFDSAIAEMRQRREIESIVAAELQRAPLGNERPSCVKPQ
nr:transporter substrate-binding domain-containing protein [uncultured Pseudogulbenkiania sp.]